MTPDAAMLKSAALPLFIDPAKELLAQLASTKVDELSPMAAFELLRQWKEKYGK